MKPATRSRREILRAAPPPERWPEIWPGFRVWVLWQDPKTRALIGLFRCAKGCGSGPHSHASNQMMYCLEGEYYYRKTRLTLNPGSFYLNPRGNVHGPTVAKQDTIVLEIYDGDPTPIPAPRSAGPPRRKAKTGRRRPSRARLPRP